MSKVYWLVLTYKSGDHMVIEKVPTATKIDCLNAIKEWKDSLRNCSGVSSAICVEGYISGDQE